MLRKALLVAPLLLIAGCGGSSSVASRPANTAFSTDLTSIFKDIKSYGSGAVTVGWNQLTGTTTLNGSNATVELQATVNYRNGSGQFDGLVTVTLPDTSAMTLLMKGTASLNSSTSTTSFVSNLTWLGGSGSLASANANGSFTGSRSTALGGAVHLDVKLQMNP